MATEFTPKQLQHFKAYRKVQESGRYNMMADANAAMQDAGLTRDEYMFVIRNYSSLAAVAAMKE